MKNKTETIIGCNRCVFCQTDDDDENYCSLHVDSLLTIPNKISKISPQDFNESKSVKYPDYCPLIENDVTFTLKHKTI